MQYRAYKRLMLRSFFLLSTIILEPAVGKADKFDFTSGSYQFLASNKSNNTTSALSGFGSYHLGFRHQIFSNFELDLGYSLLATDGFTGDLSFGFDAGLNYFPLTSPGNIRVQSGDDVAVFQSRWRPYIGMGFHQRNFQSINSQYAGAGIKLGCEYHGTEQISYIGMIRYISLGGPNNSDATQQDFSFGASFQF